MELIKALLEQQPLMALFPSVAIGYLVGEINIKGFSLGVGAVLFVALAVGWFAPKSAPVAMVGTLGLALFLYAVGVQYGKQFFIGLTSAAGRRGVIVAHPGNGASVCAIKGGQGVASTMSFTALDGSAHGHPLRRPLCAGTPGSLETNLVQ